MLGTNSDNQVLSSNQELWKQADQQAAPPQNVVGTESQPTERGVQTQVPEQKQMSTPYLLPAVKKTRTRVIKPPSKFKNFVA